MLVIRIDHTKKFRFCCIRYITPRQVQFGLYFAHTMTSGLQKNAVDILESQSVNKKIGSKTYIDLGKLFLEKGTCEIQMKPVNWTHESEHTYHSIHPTSTSVPVGPSFGEDSFSVQGKFWNVDFEIWNFCVSVIKCTLKVIVQQFFHIIMSIRFSIFIVPRCSR